jgi:hypothetical protein
METNKCLACNKPLRGRIDKKFCDDACRNGYNNQIKAKTNHSGYIRSINNSLLKNRRVLSKLIPTNEETSKVHQDKLSQLGFIFKYHTHTYANKKGNIYYFIYDYGYLPLENNWYLVVKRKEEAI